MPPSAGKDPAGEPGGPDPDPSGASTARGGDILTERLTYV